MIAQDPFPDHELQRMVSRDKKLLSNRRTSMLAPLYLKNGKRMFLECGVTRTCLQDGLRILSATLVLDALAEHDLHLRFISTGLCVPKQKTPTSSAKETREHVKRVGMMLTSFMSFQAFL